MTQPQIRALIADDQRVVCDGLTMLDGLIEGIEVVALPATVSKRSSSRGAQSRRSSSWTWACVRWKE